MKLNFVFKKFRNNGVRQRIVPKLRVSFLVGFFLKINCTDVMNLFVCLFVVMML